jgi:hypothetical protein
MELEHLLVMAPKLPLTQNLLLLSIRVDTLLLSSRNLSVTIEAPKELSNKLPSIFSPSSIAKAKLGLPCQFICESPLKTIVSLAPLKSQAPFLV